MVRAIEAGASRRAIATRFEVSPSCVVKLLPQRWRREGTLEPNRLAAAGGQAPRPRAGAVAGRCRSSAPPNPKGR
jgi:hypothetical protein